MTRSFVSKGWLLVASVLLTMILASCVVAETTPAPAPEEPVDTSLGEPASEPAAGGEVITLYVGPETADCVGVAPQQCLLVKENPEDEYTFFYGQIEGFTYEPGYEYQLLVSVEEVPDAPADASTLKYTLIEVVEKDPVADQAAAPLEGTLWQLEYYGDQQGELTAVLPDSEITAQFTDGQVGGSAGCNQYFGTYTTDGDKLTIEVGGTTMMACAPPLMDQETSYLSVLNTVAAYRISGEQLQLTDAEGAVVLTYRAVTPTNLTDTLWQATGYNNGKEAVVSVVIDTEITAVFGPDGTLTGNAGCNDYFAEYKVDGGQITIGPAGSTKKFCAEPEGIMDQESQYLASLEMAQVYRIEGDRLELRTTDGALVASYNALPSEATGAAEVDPELVTALGNIEYQSEFTESGMAPLSDGMYEEEIAPDSASKTTVMLLPDSVVTGELDGQPSAAVILATNAGGSGTFIDLAVVVEQDGQLTNVATTNLGDRVDVQSIAFENDQIVVDMITQGPEDPMCCPTQEVIHTYELQGGELVLVDSQIIGTVEPAEEASGLVGVLWTWQETQYNNDTETVVEEPERYTLQFQANGSVSIKADCNQVGGTYTADGSSLSIALGPSTMAACPPDSLADEYLLGLTGAASFVFDGQDLIINIMMDAGNMRFAAADEAVGSPTPEEAPQPAEPAPSAPITMPTTSTTTSVPSAPSTPTADITGITWKWVSFTDPVNGPSEIPDPEDYTLELSPTGIARVRADCNRGGGTYTIEDGSITIQITTLTRALCAPDSLSDQYLQYLDAASIYFTQDGDLFLDLFADGGTMRFAQ
jgi:heat shock protein HslJ